MFFFSLTLFLIATWCAPWWMCGLIGFAAGFLRPGFTMRRLQLSVASGLAWAALAYVQDGRNFGLVSRRLGGLMHLPHPLLIFVIMAVLGFVTVLLAAQSGASLRRLINPSTDF
jgi:hypothetical protein